MFSLIISDQDGATVLIPPIQITRHSNAYLIPPCLTAWRMQDVFNDNNNANNNGSDNKYQ